MVADFQQVKQEENLQNFFQQNFLQIFFIFRTYLSITGYLRNILSEKCS